MIRKFQHVALFALLGFCVAGCAYPRLVFAEESGTAAKQEARENPHELLYHTINFLILVGALAYILRKPVAEFLKSRSSSVEKALDEGRKALDASQAQLREVEAKLEGLEAEIAAFKDSAAREMEAERQRIQKGAEEEAARILEAAHAQINAAVRSARLELKKFTAERSVSIAEDLIRSRLDDSGRQRLVAQFAASLGTGERKN